MNQDMQLNSPSLNGLWGLKKKAWGLGRKSQLHPDLAQDNLNALDQDILKFSGGKPNDELVKIVKASYGKGLAADLVPTDIPEQAMAALKWYEENVRQTFRKREHSYRLTRSQNYILLSFLVYALSFGGCREFTFAEHRIHDLLTSNGYKISTGTISRFYGWARKIGFLEVVREGDNRPGCHAPATFRVLKADDLAEAFGMNEQSKIPEAEGYSFAEWVRRHLKLAS